MNAYICRNNSIIPWLGNNAMRGGGIGGLGICRLFLPFSSIGINSSRCSCIFMFLVHRLFALFLTHGEWAHFPLVKNDANGRHGRGPLSMYV